MKIVWLGHNMKRRIPFSPYSYCMQVEMSKLANVVFYGGGGGKFIPEFDVEKIVGKEQPDVLVFFNNQKSFVNISKVKTPKYCKCSDPHEPNFSRHIVFINKYKADLTSICCCEGIMEKYKAKTKQRIVYLPDATCSAFFKDLGLKRDLDVYFAGSSNHKTYPLRARLITKLSKEKQIKFLLRHSEVQNVSEVEWEHQLTRYVIELNRAKITPFGTSIYNYALRRFGEGMACNSLVLAPVPKDANFLHFIPNKNFIQINMLNFMEKIHYYLKHENERKTIAKKGLETIKKYHTVKIRAKQLYDYLREIIE